MTQKEFEHTKTWLEKVTSLDFNGVDCDGDNESIFEEGIAHFTKTIPNTKNLIILSFGDDGCSLTMLLENGQDIHLYRANTYNTQICVDIFCHIIRYNY